MERTGSCCCCYYCGGGGVALGGSGCCVGSGKGMGYLGEEED